jgi:transcriptional regulator with XRE-family HTH domain
MDLALDVGVSPRHLGFVELGRSRPSPELLMAIADRLDVPLRERNQWLLAAGYAPRYTETPLDGPSLALMGLPSFVIGSSRGTLPALVLRGLK